MWCGVCVCVCVHVCVCVCMCGVCVGMCGGECECGDVCTCTCVWVCGVWVLQCCMCDVLVKSTHTNVLSCTYSKVRERAARRACRGLGTALSGKAAARNDFRDIFL